MEHLVNKSEKLKRSISILIDISTLPRYLTGAVMSLGLGRGLASNVTAFYAEGIYSDRSGAFMNIFTGERWRFIPMPGLEGRYDPTKDRYILVSIGFEGQKTLRHVARQEPDRVSVLLADPGFEPSYSDVARKNNDEFMRYFHVPEDQIACAHAGDAIAAWAELSARHLERMETENVQYLCCGSKPHSLALILRALSLGSPSVLYNIPDIHKVINPRVTGNVWTYDIHDITRL